MKGGYSMYHRGMGLISNRHWSGMELDRWHRCRDNYPAARPMPPLASDAKLFAWLLAPETVKRQLAPVAVRVRAR